MGPNRERFIGGRAPATRHAAAVAFAVLLVVAPEARLGQGPVAGSPHADPHPGTLPSARSILDRHVEAIGGAEALRRHRSTHVKGTVSMPAAGISGTLEAYAARPNKSLVRVSLGGVGEVTEAFDGTVGWSVSPLTGPMLLEGRQLEEKRFDAEYDHELRSEGRYTSMATIDRIEFDGRVCYKVSLVRATGGEDIEFYDVETGLKAGAITTRETPMGAVTGTTFESDYRRFDGLLHPTTVRSRIGGIEQVISITAVEFDTVPSSVFEMPPDIRALLR